MTSYQFALDVAYNSSVEPFRKDKIVPMVHGFAKAPIGGTFKEDGQKVVTLQSDSPFFFSIFDVAQYSPMVDPPKLTQAIITIERLVDNPVEAPPTPFVKGGEKVKSPITVTSFPEGIAQASAGCNVLGGSWVCLDGYSVIANTTHQDWKYECTVELLVTGSNPDSPTLTYKTDPELIVEGTPPVASGECD